MRTILALTLAALLGATSSAFALKWSDQSKVAAAIKAIAMADNLASGTPTSITVRVNMPSAGGPLSNRKPAPEVVLTSGTAFDNLLAAVTTKLNADKTTAQNYLASVSVTND